jgi:hypothetical protein
VPWILGAPGCATAPEKASLKLDLTKAMDLLSWELSVSDRPQMCPRDRGARRPLR